MQAEIRKSGYHCPVLCRSQTPSTGATCSTPRVTPPPGQRLAGARRTAHPAAEGGEDIANGSEDGSVGPADLIVVLTETDALEAVAEADTAVHQCGHPDRRGEPESGRFIL
jgi:hypothetical protein